MKINEYLSSFYKGTKTPTLEAMQFFMEKLGHPEKHLRIVHVAGTNGKGSVTEMLTNILEHAGYNVGKFMSPHIIHFNERICINHKEILDEDLEELLKIIDPFVKEYNEAHEEEITLFELETAIALYYFAKKKCDIVVLETGLGGKYDCTNVVHPIASVITSIGYDHMNILGNTIEEIATQKAGIIKENSNTIFCEQEESVNEIIKNTCNAKNNNLHFIEKQAYKNASINAELSKVDYKQYKQVEINLKGRKQIENACLVMETIDILRDNNFNISEEDVRIGLKTVIHKARFEKIYSNPTIIFDGGHNEAAIRNLKDTIKTYYPNNKKIYIVSILKTKDYKTVIKELMEDKEATFIFTDGTIEKDEVKCYQEKETLYKEACKYREENIYMSSLKQAIIKCKQLQKDIVIFVIGSFYTYKEVMEFIKSYDII